MTLRLRYYLMLISLFAGFGVANAALFFLIVRKEVAWSISEQSKGRAICVASFIGRELRPDSPNFKATMSAALTRMSATAQGLNVQWFEESASETGWDAVPLFVPPSSTSPLRPEFAIGDLLRKGEACSRFISQSGSDADLSCGYAAVLGKTGEMRAVVAVSNRDTVLRTESEAVLRQCLWYCGIVTLLGLLVAEILTRIARRGISLLEEGADALAKGDYSYDWQPNRITELHDLSNTLKTISQILQEGIHQAWRRFFQAELLPRQEEIAMDCQAFCDSALRDSTFGLQVAVRRISGGDLNDFWGMRSEKSSWRLIAGRLEPSAQDTDMLGQIVRANSARDYLLGCSSTGSTAEVWDKMHRVFPCIQGDLVHGNEGSDKMVRSSFSAGSVTREAEANAKERGILGTLGEESKRFALSYVLQYPEQPIETIADKLAIILAPNSKGVLVIYEFKPTQR